MGAGLLTHSSSLLADEGPEEPSASFTWAMWPCSDSQPQLKLLRATL
jgi:hypothetical protein